jgi:hypothetical protein
MYAVSLEQRKAWKMAIILSKEAIRFCERLHLAAETVFGRVLCNENRKNLPNCDSI